MGNENISIPGSWLSLLDEKDVTGWLTSFVVAPQKAVDDLIWDAFYFGPLNLTDRGQLLVGWLNLLGNNEQFAERLDMELANWVIRNWGNFNYPAPILASAWACLCSVVELSAKLPQDLRLMKAATVLKERFANRQQYLGGFSVAPASDPLGIYLAVIAEFQADDRSLATYWHQMCNLPDGVPFYHARYAMLGLRRLKALQPIEDGTLRAEVVLGLIRMASAFYRLVQERGLPENIAKATFRRVATQTAAAYPNSPRWLEFGLTETLRLSDKPRQWLYGAVPALAPPIRRRNNVYVSKSLKSITPDPTWSRRAFELAKKIENGDKTCLRDVKRLLDEERLYAENTGDTFALQRSLGSFASRIVRFNSNLALEWAREAFRWRPDDPFVWSMLRKILVKKGNLEEALRFSWVAWKRFPEDVVSASDLAQTLKANNRYREAETIYTWIIKRFPKDLVARTSLAEVLKGMERYDEAETVYRKAIDEFSEHNVILLSGLADTLRRAGRWDESEVEYRRIVSSEYVDPPALVGLAYLILRKGEDKRDEALELVNLALKLDPRDEYTRSLRNKLTPEASVPIENLLDDWDKAAASIFNKISYIPDENIWNEFPIKQEQLEDNETESSFPSNRKESQPHTSSDSLILASLVAEAYFYRLWAKDVNSQRALSYRNRSSNLLAKAEQIVPLDPLVFAEKMALSLDRGEKLSAYEGLKTKLENLPAAIPLLMLKARMDREKAREEQLALNDSILTELCKVPQQLRDINPTLSPLFHFQKGLAALALFNGNIRKETAADSFSRFRRIIAQRAIAEKKRLPMENNFHEWFADQISDRVFASIARPNNVDVYADDITILENAWRHQSGLIEEIEDVFTDHLVFGSV